LRIAAGALIAAGERGAQIDVHLSVEEDGALPEGGYQFVGVDLLAEVHGVVALLHGEEAHDDAHHHVEEDRLFAALAGPDHVAVEEAASLGEGRCRPRVMNREAGHAQDLILTQENQDLDLREVVMVVPFNSPALPRFLCCPRRIEGKFHFSILSYGNIM